MPAPTVLPAVTLHGGPAATVLGQSPARIPTAGKIRAGIKVLSTEGPPPARSVASIRRAPCS